MSPAIIALIIIGVTLVLMIGQWIPMAVTALAAAFAMALCGVMSFSDVLTQFGTSAFFCVVGMMVVGGSLFDTGVVSDISRVLMKRGGNAKSVKAFAALVLVVVTLLSAFLSNTTCAAMFLPLVAGLARESKDIAMQKNMRMFVGVAATLGGCATLVGSPSQHAMAQQLLEDGEHQLMSLFYGTPATLLMLVLTVGYFMLIGYRLGKAPTDSTVDGLSVPEENAPEGALWKKVVSIGILLLSIILIATGVVSSGAGALMGAVLCVLTGCVSFEKAIGKISWPVVIMFGGLLGMARGFNLSGAGDLVVQFTINTLGANAHPYIVFAVITFVAVLLTNVLDNIASQALLGPISLALATAYGINPTTMIYAVLFACNMAFATPLGTPAMTMTLVGGYRFSDYLKVGGPLCLLGYAFIVTAIPLLYGFWA